MLQGTLRDVSTVLTSGRDVSGLDANRLRVLTTQRIREAKAEFVVATGKHLSLNKQGQNLAIVIPQTITDRPTVIRCEG